MKEEAQKGRTVPEEGYKIRCPRLGHQIAFSYCRRENLGLPCFKTLDCWHPHFQVERHLRAALTQAEWERTFTPRPKPKILSLVELIEQARKGQSQ